MDLIVDDQSPVPFAEQPKMRVLLQHRQSLSAYSAFAVGHRLIGGDSHRADFLALAGVFTDFRLGQTGLRQQLVDPLPHCDGVRREDQRTALHLRHDRHPDDRLARTARHNTTTPEPPREVPPA